MEKYGVDNYSKTDEYKEKVKKTSMEKYGVDSPNKSNSIKIKKVQSMINKYGFISNSMTEVSKNKLKETNMQRYGVEYPMQVVEFFNKQQKSSFSILEFEDTELYYQSTYELDFLLKMKEVGQIHNIRRGKVIYYYENGLKRAHFPDFYMENLNIIIEIKSNYTYNKYLDRNILKQKACVDIGYNYLYIIDKNYDTILNIIKNHK